MNENNIIDALNSYDGTQPSLEKTVSVLSNEVGPDWMDKIFEQLGDLPVELKEKLNHVFNYYASLMAWNEAQAYLEQEEPLDKEMMDERLPILKHWLDFFGQPGQDLYRQLEELYQKETAEKASETTDTEGDDTADTASTAPQNTDDISNEEDETVADNTDPAEASKADHEDSTPLSDADIPVENNTIPNSEIKVEEINDDLPEMASDNSSDFEKDEEFLEEDNTPEGFAIRKAEREIVLLDDLQSWLAARCHQLGDIETFAYPYFGMVVDLMRQTVKDIQVVLDLENQDIVNKYYPEGLDVLTRKKEAIEADIQTAVENCESDTTALIEEGMDMNKVKKALGDLDTSTEKEYLGPAPDGFELLDDKPIDEEAVKEQYEQLEENAQKNTEKQDISVTDEKKASQNEQNGVQRKLSFSLKPKKG